MESEKCEFFPLKSDVVLDTSQTMMRVIDNLSLEEQEKLMQKIKKSLQEKSFEKMNVKQVNVLMEGKLYQHLENVTNVLNMFNEAEKKNKISVSEVIRKAVSQYYDYENTVIVKTQQEDGTFNTQIKSKDYNENSLAGHNLLQKLIRDFD